MAAAPPFDRVVFDCDSTLSTIEGIEELAAGHPEQAEAIAAMTSRAMAGEIPLAEVYGRRLELLAPRQLEVMRIGSRYVETAVPGGRELVSALHALGKEVRIISGGLRMPVVTLAGWLGVKDEEVSAVKVYFDHHGKYRDFEHDNPLTRNGGKITVLKDMPPARTAFVGDGITDAEAKEVVDAFIAFCGVVERDEVVARADAVCRVNDLVALLPLLITDDERDVLRRDPRHRPLLNRAVGR